jgi:hypothetical protein
VPLSSCSHAQQHRRCIVDCTASAQCACAAQPKGALHFRPWRTVVASHLAHVALVLCCHGHHPLRLRVCRGQRIPRVGAGGLGLCVCVGGGRQGRAGQEQAADGVLRACAGGRECGAAWCQWRGALGCAWTDASALTATAAQQLSLDTHTHTSKSVRSSLRCSPRLVLGAVAVSAMGDRPMLSAPSGLTVSPTFDMFAGCDAKRVWLGKLCVLASEWRGRHLRRGRAQNPSQRESFRRERGRKRSKTVNCSILYSGSISKPRLAAGEAA